MRRPVVRVVAALLALVILSVGCGSGVSTTDQSQQQLTASAESVLRSRGFTKVTLQIRHADGTIEEHCVWLADSAIENQRGLMGIADPLLGGGDALVFAFDGEVSNAFWMKDTLLPLSLVWVDSAGAVIGTQAMEPCPAGTDACPRFPPPRPYRLAIEMAQGRPQDWGIGPGAMVFLGDEC